MHNTETVFFPGLVTVAVFLLVLIVIFLASAINVHRVWSRKLNHQFLREIALLDNDRERIASDLHDEIAPLITLAGMLVGRLKIDDEKDIHYRKRARESIQSSIQRLGEIVRNLSPSILETRGVKSALETLIDRTSETTDMKIEMKYELAMIIQPKNALHIYRIVQELLHNSIKHSGADSIYLEFREEGKKIFMLYTDNGKGFDGSVMHGHGTKSLQDRINALRGSIRLDTKPDHGTRYIIYIPITSIYEFSYPGNHSR